MMLPLPCFTVNIVYLIMNSVVYANHCSQNVWPWFHRNMIFFSPTCVWKISTVFLFLCSLRLAETMMIWRWVVVVTCTKQPLFARNFCCCRSLGSLPDHLSSHLSSILEGHPFLANVTVLQFNVFSTLSSLCSMVQLIRLTASIA